MKRLRPAFRKFSKIFTQEVPFNEIHNQVDFIEFEISYYEAGFSGKAWPMDIREALDCVDLVVLHQQDDRFYGWWPRLHELYRLAKTFLEDRSGFMDPIFGQGMYEMKKVESRYVFKRRILQGYAQRLEVVLV